MGMRKKDLETDTKGTEGEVPFRVTRIFSRSDNQTRTVFGAGNFYFQIYIYIYIFNLEIN